MRLGYGWAALPSIVLSGSAVVGVLLAAEAPAPPKPSSYAPAKDLAEQVEFFRGRLEESLAKKADYDEATQSRVKKDANTLAVLSLTLALHDEDSPLKASASAVLSGAQKLAKASSDYDESAKAWAEIKAAGSSPAAPGELKWGKVAGLGSLMKQVTFVQAGLKRAVTGTRFQKQSAQAAGQAATLAVIAQASIFDTHEVKNPADLDQWYQFCAEMRDAAADVNRAARAGDQAKAAAGLTALQQSCDRCHGVFRKEEK